MDCQDKDNIMLAVGDKLLKCKDVTSYLRLRIAVVVTIVGVLLPGCAVGPNFRSSKAPSTNAYTATALSEKTAAAPGIGGTAQCFVPGQDISAQWWTLFHSEALDQLIHLALTDSPTLEAAQATLRQAQENLRAQVGVVFFPKMDANFSAERERFSAAAFGQTGTTGTTFNLYNASVSVSYLLDIFGGGRRELESLQSQVDYQRFQLEGSYLTLTSNIVTAAVKEASLRSQIRATREILTVQEKAARCGRMSVPAWGGIAFRRACPADASCADSGNVTATGKGAFTDSPSVGGACRHAAERSGLARVRARQLTATAGAAGELAVIPGSPASGHRGLGSSAARRQRADRSGDCQPLSADHPQRQLWVGGVKNW